AAVRRALRNRRFVGGLLLMSLPALLFGVLGVLGPLHLAAAGWGAAAVGAVWLTGAALESAQAPLVGRLVDRRGRLLPVRGSRAPPATRCRSCSPPPCAREYCCSCAGVGRSGGARRWPTAPDRVRLEAEPLSRVEELQNGLELRSNVLHCRSPRGELRLERL